MAATTTNDNGSSFTFATKDSEPYPEAIKWSQGNAKYEVHVPILKSLDIHDVVSHCLSVRTKVMSTVGTEAHKGPSLYKVFQRSLSLVLSTVWVQINNDADTNAAVDNSETLAHFDERIREFIAAHSTAEDRYELVQHLRAARKPRRTVVQSFWYLLREYNSFVDWMPGTEPALNETQLKQAVHDAMPPPWKERFGNSGKSIASLTTAEMVQCFRKQEKQAND